MRHHVLIYHYCMATEPCDRFNWFVNSTDYKFATVDTKDDVKALSITGLACKNLVEIRDHYRVWGSTKKDSLAELASAIMDPYYEKDEAGCPENMSRILAWGLVAATGLTSPQVCGQERVHMLRDAQVDR